MSSQHEEWDDETWDTLAGLIEEGWPGEFDDAASDAWRVLLEGFAPQQVLYGLRKLIAEGRRFRPSVSEVVAALRDDPSRPTFAEAYQLIFGSGGILRARPAQRTYVDERERRQVADEAMRERASRVHPLVASFVERQGYERLRLLPLADPEYGAVRRRELGEAWNAHVEAMDRREGAALASGEGQHGLRSLDPLASLGVDRAAAQLPAGERSEA